LTLILSAQSTVHNALILIAFIALAVVVALVAVRSSERTMPLLERTLESSSQLAVRWILVLVFALALLALELGLDLLLGGFAAGVITRQVLRRHEMPSFDSKLSAVAFGVFVPFFFVASGMKLDVAALFASVTGVLKMVAFFLIFLLVRGTPALVLYRHVLDRRERIALALMSSTQLPMVLAITTLATSTGHMRASTAAALVGAAVLSTLVFPALGLRLRCDLAAEHAPAAAGHEPQCLRHTTPIPHLGLSDYGEIGDT
jgi:Kef-type K+ transport system membrane component KefB